MCWLVSNKTSTSLLTKRNERSKRKSSSLYEVLLTNQTQIDIISPVFNNFFPVRYFILHRLCLYNYTVQSFLYNK